MRCFGLLYFTCAIKSLRFESAIVQISYACAVCVHALSPVGHKRELRISMETKQVTGNREIAWKDLVKVQICVCKFTHKTDWECTHLCIHVHTEICHTAPSMKFMESFF